MNCSVLWILLIIIYVRYSDTSQLATSKQSACRIICTETPENGGMAGAFPLLFFQKGGQRGRRCIFIISVGASTFWGCDFLPEGFLPAFPQTCPKSYLCNFYLQLFSHKDHEDIFWCDLRKRSSCVFLQTLATLGAIFNRIFRDFAQIFSKSKLLGVRLHPYLQHHCVS